METNGAISVSRTVNGGTEDRIRIAVRVPDGPRVLVELTPEDFGLAITGLSERPCVVTVNTRKEGAK